MNRAILIGRIVRDPELRFTPNGTATCSFTLAVDRNFKNKDGQKEADFINIVAWNKLAETIANYAAKGRLVAVSGRIQTRTYEGNDGQKRYVTEIVADDFQFLEKKDGGQTSRTSSNNNVPDDSDFFNVPDDDNIPF